MAVKMRLRREGKRKQPYYRVVVADVRSPRDGRFIEDLGYYQPLRDPSAISINAERALYWLRNGVQPSDAVRNLLKLEGIWEQFKPGEGGTRTKEEPSQKTETGAGQQPEPAPSTDAPQDQAATETLEQARAEVAQPGTEVSGGGPADDEPGAAGATDEPEAAGATDDEQGSAS